jgi:carbon-monoxide dehydrogenase medium subunit
MDMAIVGVATAITLDKGKERIEEIKIVLGAVSPIPMRAQKAEDRLRGTRIDKISIDEASRLASEEARPITDLHGSAEYRKEMVRVITKKSIRQAMDDIL